MSYEEKNAALDQLIRPLPNPRYTIDASFRYIEHQFNGYEQDSGGLNLEPEMSVTPWPDATSLAIDTVRDECATVPR